MTGLDAYINDIRRQLARKHVADRDEIIAELRDAAADVFAETGMDGVLESFGTPEEIAAAASDGSADDRVFRVLGVPADFRGATSARARSRIWDPGNPDILVPHLFGIGWSVNLGAIAVRLGLIRPDDDADEDVLSAIPPAVVTASRLTPLLPLAVTAATYFGRRDFRQQHPDSAAHARQGLIVTAVVSGWSVLPPAPSTEDRLARASIGTTIATISGASIGTTIATISGASVVADATLGEPRAFSMAVGIPSLLLGLAGGLATILIPIRIGLRRVWQKEGLNR